MRHRLNVGLQSRRFNGRLLATYGDDAEKLLQSGTVQDAGDGLRTAGGRRPIEARRPLPRRRCQSNACSLICLNQSLTDLRIGPQYTSVTHRDTPGFVVVVVERMTPVSISLGKIRSPWGLWRASAPQAASCRPPERGESVDRSTDRRSCCRRITHKRSRL